MRRKIINLIRTYKKTTLFGIISATVIFLVVLSTGGSDVTYETFIAERGTVTQRVSVTGRVQSAHSVDLAPEKGGKIIYIPVETGEHVGGGDLLLSTNNSSLFADLEQAKANLEIQKIKLNDTGESSQVNLENARNELIDKINDGFTKADNAVHNEADQLFTNNVIPKFNTKIYVISIEDRSTIDLGRSRVAKIFDEWAELSKMLDSETNLADEAEAVEGHLEAIQQFMNNLGYAVNGWPNDITLNAYKTTVSTARTSVNTALTNLRSAKQGYATAQSALANGSLFDDVLIQEANVKDAQAKVDSVVAQIEQTRIRAPFAGTVTKIDAELGEIIPSNQPVISLSFESLLEIKAFIPEADVANLDVGDTAAFSLDAYGEDISFGATVFHIDPAPELIEGVASYRTLLELQDDDERVRIGMTADLDIITVVRENVVFIPQRAVIFRGGSKIVRILHEDGSISEINVSLGITGERGSIEIINGIEGGDIIITAINE